MSISVDVVVVVVVEGVEVDAEEEGPLDLVITGRIVMMEDVEEVVVAMGVVRSCHALSLSVHSWSTSNVLNIFFLSQQEVAAMEEV